MVLRRSSKGLSAGQLLGILAFTLALFFMFSFAAKSVEAYRLRAWRDELRQELAAMEREELALHNELRRRRTNEWKDEALRRAGWLPPDVVSVIIVTPVAPAQPASALPEPTEAAASPSSLPANHWQAWLDLVLGSSQPVR